MKNLQYINKKFFRKLVTLTILLAVSLGAMAQQTVTGTVVDENNQALPGVNIYIKGTQKGTVTDLEGNYSIQVNSPNAVLVYSFIGYTDHEEVVGSRTSIDVKLTEESKSLEEVVVIGYGKQKKVDLSGSVAVVSTEDLEDLPITSSGEALKGRVSGVLVNTNTGQPGAGPSILIRGKSSINASNSPLVVVDGIPGVDMNDIDFRDVTSMTVLKDGASAAIYGSAGANGVILITTKRGKAGKTQIQFNTYQEWVTPPKKIDLLNSQQSFDLIREIDTQHEIDVYLGDHYESNKMIDTTNLVQTDWQDQLFRKTAPVRYYNLSFSGGNENIVYRISGSYNSNTGYIRPASDEKFTLRSNLDYTFSDKLKMVTDLALNRDNRKNVPTGDFAWNGTSMLTALNTIPFLPIYASDGSFFINPLQPNIDIPNAGIADANSSNYQTSIYGRYGLYYDIIPGLTYEFEFTPRLNLSKKEGYTSKYLTYIGRSIGGSASSSSSENLSWTLQNTLTYTKSFGKHNLVVMGGFEGNRSSTHNNAARAQGFPTDSIPHVINALNPSGGSGWNEYAKYSYLARLNYNFAQKYYLQFNLRSDGSSRFGPNYQWGTFPSASVAWRLSQEKFMANLDFISELKLRGTYGYTGNDGFGNYLYISTYGPGHNYPIWGTDDVATGYLPSSLYNPNLKWEQSLEKSIGLDLTLWNGRIDFTAEGYIKNTNDLLYNASPPITTGFGSAWVNIGEVQSKGYDLNLTSRNISQRDFVWTTNITFSGNTSEVISLGDLKENQFSGVYIISPGLPVDAFWGWKTAGIFQNQEQIDALNKTAPDGSTIYYQNEQTAPGDIIFRNINGYERDEDGNLLLDANGDPYEVINSSDQTYIGTPNPDFFYGVDNTFRYKNLELDFFFQGVYGNKIMSNTRREIERMDHYFNYSATVLNRWQYEGQNTNIPRATLADPNENNRTSDRWIEDGSYLRLKYVTLGYNLPENFAGKLGMTKARLYITLENMLTITNYSLYDPEIATNGRGLDMGGYPQGRNYMIGLSVGF